ncbi:hypothetical protein BGZ49_002420 [Haplosporangium sp. Z 27]|nr:hypothetical protein BGZ49_002420 [Haplosporangium sp. Z 27]
MKIITIGVTVIAVILGSSQAAPLSSRTDIVKNYEVIKRDGLVNSVAKDAKANTNVENVKEVVYHAKAPIKEGLQAGAIGAGVGLLVSAAQNSVGSHSEGAMGVFSRTGGTIGIFAAMAGVFAATDSAVANVRETKDAWNSVAAGCASGLVAGGFQRNAQTMVFGCLGMGAMMGLVDLSGSSLKGTFADVSEQQKQEWRQSQLNTK